MLNTTGTHSETGPNNAVGVLASGWALVGTSTVIVLLRLYSKSFIVRKVGWDDVLMSLSVVSMN